MAGTGWDDERKLVTAYVGSRVSRLQNGVLSQRHDAIADMARLRRAANTTPGSDPDVWVVEFDGMPDELIGRGPEPSHAEWAVHAALTLYAQHQQSKSTEMHRVDREHGTYKFGNAMRELVARTTRGDDEPMMPRRLQSMMKAQKIEGTIHYARQLVSLLRANSIPIDYGLFAGQLLEHQNPCRQEYVRREWSREWTRWRPSSSKKR